MICSDNLMNDWGHIVYSPDSQKLILETTQYQ